MTITTEQPWTRAKAEEFSERVFSFYVDHADFHD